MKTREILISDWYQSMWPHVQLQSGQDQKIKYSTTASGWRLSTSTGGRATGEHPDFKLCDDPLSAAQAQSDAERTRANDWFDTTLSTRGVSRGSRTIVVMQRLHEQDVAGHILTDVGGYNHICLPMRYEKGKTAHPEDPRTKEGQLLWPELFSSDTVLVLEKRLGEYGAAGQLQQRPAPPGGGILKTEHLQKWPSSRPLPHFQFILQSYDTAFTEKTSGDPTACTVWGIFDWKNQQQAMLLDSWSDHLGYPDLRAKVIDEWSSLYGGDKTDPMNKPRRADLLLIEEKGSGISLIQDLRRSGIGVRTYNPGRMDKVSRAHQFAPILEMGCVWIPESKKNPNEYVSWAMPLLDQLEKFPNAAHDDLVDTTTMGFLYFRDSKMLELPYVQVIDEPEEVDYHARSGNTANPYAQ
jgi:predicted phage terminase large subunit-like protein